MPDSLSYETTFDAVFVIMSKKTYLALISGLIILLSEQLWAETLVDDSSVSMQLPEHDNGSSTIQDNHTESVPKNIQSEIAIDRIVAIVNEEIITQRELDNATRSAVTNLMQQGVEPPDPDLLQKQVLEAMIMKSIQLQHAKELGMSISDSKLDETISRIADENNLSLQEFYSVLEQDGVNFNEFRKEIRNEMLTVRLKEREIKNLVNVTDGEVDNYLRTQEASGLGNDEYLLAHIMVSITEHMTPVQINERATRAEQALKKLQEGVDFAQVAAEFSDAPNAMKGGVLEWRPIAQMGPTFMKLLSPLEIGETTPVVKSPDGFHIFKILDQRESNNQIVTINQTQARHILVKINELVSENDAMQEIIQIKARIDNGEDFAELAKLYSEDSSASSGGDLGWLSPGNTVPPFEQAMDALAPGQVSDPVKTQFGWHLIEVIERREQDVSSEHQREKARKAIRTRKAEVVVQDMLRALRDQAYVEYRMEDI